MVRSSLAWMVLLLSGAFGGSAEAATYRVALSYGGPGDIIAVSGDISVSEAGTLEIGDITDWVLHFSHPSSGTARTLTPSNSAWSSMGFPALIAGSQLTYDVSFIVAHRALRIDEFAPGLTAWSARSSGGLLFNTESARVGDDGGFEVAGSGVLFPVPRVLGWTLAPDLDPVAPVPALPALAWLAMGLACAAALVHRAPGGAGGGIRTRMPKDTRF